MIVVVISEPAASAPQTRMDNPNKSVQKCQSFLSICVVISTTGSLNPAEHQGKKITDIDV